MTRPVKVSNETYAELVETAVRDGVPIKEALRRRIEREVPRDVTPDTPPPDTASAGGWLWLPALAGLVVLAWFLVKDARQRQVPGTTQGKPRDDQVRYPVRAGYLR